MFTRSRWPARLALTGYMALLVWLSHQPSLPVPDWQLPHLDKLLHFLAYTVLGALAYRAAPGTGTRRLLIAVTVGWLFGVSDELHQAVVPGRDASALDWIADALGAVMGSYAMVRWRREIKKPTPNPKDV